MASNFLGINRGKLQTMGSVSASAATNATDFELRIDTGKSSTKEDVILALDLLKIYIISNGVGGAGAGVNLPPA
jgi:hypothetical protein